MRELVFIINGSAGWGKDTFVDYVDEHLYLKGADFLLLNYSSVSKVKKVAELCGWNGVKTEKDRKFLSDLKLLTTEYNDMALNDMIEKVEGFRDFAQHHNRVIFLHIREPEEIERAKNVFNALTILVKRDEVEHITSNMADANVLNYNYDIVVENNSGFDNLVKIASRFANDIVNDELDILYN